MIPPGVVEHAIAELEWSLAHRAKVVLMRPAPAWGYRGPRSFALPEFDPFWARVQESGVLVAIHASDTGYIRYANEWEGRNGEMLAFGAPQTFSHVYQTSHRDIQDAVLRHQRRQLQVGKRQPRGR